MRVGIYAALAVLAFVLSLAVGAFGAAVLGGGLDLPGGQEPQRVGGREEDSVPQDTNGADSQYAAPEGIGRDGEDASTGTPLWEALRGCEQSQEDCARDFVAEVAPKAEYAGGRIDTDDSGRSRHVLYFVDPARAPCEYRMFESSADGSGDSSYVVLIAGEGSFAQGQPGGSEAGCLPEL